MIKGHLMIDDKDVLVAIEIVNGSVLIHVAETADLADWEIKDNVVIVLEPRISEDCAPVVSAWDLCNTEPWRASSSGIKNRE